MMDGSQELMTFRAGEVLGDLETPDASGQCGSFPFDVVASDEGCRMALFPEPHATAVLARSHDIGSRFFRLLRDRLRLALWHYDIRELVGEYLECGNERLEKRLLHRCARALLWAAAIESRGRTTAFGEEVAFFDPETIARRFKPGTERIDFGVVIRQLHLLRMIDAFPGAALRKEEEARASASWETLVASATRQHLLAGPGRRQPQATIKAHAGRLRVSGQLTKDGNRTRQFQDVVDDLAATVPGPGLSRAARPLERLHRPGAPLLGRPQPLAHRPARRPRPAPDRAGRRRRHRPHPGRPGRIPAHRSAPPHLGARHRPGLPRPPQGIHRHPRRVRGRRSRPRQPPRLLQRSRDLTPSPPLRARVNDRLRSPRLVSSGRCAWRGARAACSQEAPSNGGACRGSVASAVAGFHWWERKRSRRTHARSAGPCSPPDVSPLPSAPRLRERGRVAGEGEGASLKPRTQDPRHVGARPANRTPSLAAAAPGARPGPPPGGSPPRAWGASPFRMRWP